MATTRQTVVQPLGLVLLPNPYGQYPSGALSVATNVVMRAPGELWQAPGFGPYSDEMGAVDAICRKMMPLDSGHVYSWARIPGPNWAVWENQYGTGVSNIASLPSIAVSTHLFYDTGQIWPVRARERMLVNTQICGVFVGDNMAPNNSTQRALRSAGMPQPQLSLAAFSGGSIPINIGVAYSAIIKRTFTDGYQVFSVPSPGTKLFNNTGIVVDVQMTVRWGATAGVLAGDIIEVYRTDGLAGADASIDPGDTFKLVYSAALTSSDIVAGFVQALDKQICQTPFYQTTGRELYTNPGQETALQANRQPNTCAAMATFKSYTFFGDITERPAWSFAIPAGVAINDIPPSPANTWFKANGIGRHRGNGTITAGSATITGVAAADIAGIKQGQVILGGTTFAVGTTVSAVGVSTITMSALALIPGTTFDIADRILLDGVAIPFNSYATLIAAAQMANYEVTVDSNVSLNSVVYSTGVTVTIEPVRPNQATMTVAATNGANYQEAVPEYTATPKTFSRKRTPFLLQWSKDAEPEHVPPSNEMNVGRGTIIAMVSTKNALWIFCSDGLYRLSGDGPPWRLDLVDPSLILVAPQAFTQMRDIVFAYCNYGVVAISDIGVEPVTASTLNEQFPGPEFSLNPLVILERNELDDEILVALGGDNKVWLYSIAQKAWTTVQSSFVTANLTAMAFQRSPQSGPASNLIAITFSGSQPRYSPWNGPFYGANYLDAVVQYQPLFGEEPLVMKQYVDETLVFQPSDTTKTMTVTEKGGAIAVATLTAHNSDAYGTVGVTRAVAISQSSAPGFNAAQSATQFRFRGISQRFVYLTDQAWRK